jgi:ribonuclease HI
MAALAVLRIHTDGASRGNPGAAAFAYVIARDGEPPIEEAGCLGETTNNQAEYTALVRALERALELGADHGLLIHSDSELLVKQMNGQYRVKNEELRGLYEQAQALRRRFRGPVTIRHVRRADNSRADALCNEALDGRRGPAPRAAPDPSPPPLSPGSVPPPTPGGGGGLPPRTAGAGGKPAPTPAPPLRERALACLRQAAAAWAAGAGPSPEGLWQQLAEVLEQNGVALPPGAR